MMMAMRYNDSNPSYSNSPRMPFLTSCHPHLHSSSFPPPTMQTSTGLIVPQRIQQCPAHFQPHQPLAFNDRASTLPGIFLEDLVTERARLRWEEGCPFDQSYTYDKIMLQISWPGYATLGTWITIQANGHYISYKQLAESVALAFRSYIGAIQGLPFPSTAERRWRLLPTLTHNIGGYVFPQQTTRRAETGLEFDQLKLRTLYEVSWSVWQAEIEASI